MNSITNRISCSGLYLSLLVFLAVFMFFGLAYPHHLHYQEQFQLFLFGSNYVWDIVKQPGGVADLYLLEMKENTKYLILD